MAQPTSYGGKSGPGAMMFTHQDIHGSGCPRLAIDPFFRWYGFAIDAALGLEQKTAHLAGGFKYVLIFIPIWEKDPN